MKMKLSGKRILLPLLALLLALTLWAGFFPPVSVSASAEDYAHRYSVSSFQVEMEVREDRTIEVKEVIAVQLLGHESHGIIRDFPLGHGVTYSNINASCDHSDFDPYFQSDDSDFLSLYLRGDNYAVGQDRTYTITYLMTVPALKEEGYLPLNVIGYGWQTRLRNVSAKVTLPEGLIDYNIYSGEYGTKGNAYATHSRVENTVYISAQELPQSYTDEYGNRVAAGITLDLSFGGGVLKTHVNMPLIIAIIIGAVIFLIAILLKLLVFRNTEFVAPVNLSTPEEMDPLKMGILIDNKLDSEDLGSLVFWLAAKGYVKIDLTEDEKDPRITITGKMLPADAPNYLKAFFDGLFDRRETVLVSELKNSFYKTADNVKASASASVKSQCTMYRKHSAVWTVAFGVITVLILGGFAFFYAMMNLTANFAPMGYHYWAIFPILAFALLFSAFAANMVRQRYFKWGNPTRIVVTLMGLFAGGLVSLATLVFPCAVFTVWVGIVLAIFAAATGTVCGMFLCRTKQYSDVLGQIVGFRNFILLTEKDKVEIMLKENPELYYQILPYAQVLGVTDVWTGKFKGLDVPAPSYVVYGNNFVFDFLIWNTMFHSMTRNFSNTFVSRPSSAGGDWISEYEQIHYCA